MTAPSAPADPTPAQYTVGWVKQDNQLINPPTNLGVALSATAGTLPDGPTYWVLTAVNAAGQTTPSNEVTLTLSGGGISAADLTWNSSLNAASYDLYRGTVAGKENVLVASGITTLHYTDTGAVGTAQSPPTANTAQTGTLAVAIRTAIETANNFKDWGVMTVDHGGHYATYADVQTWADLS